MAQPTVLITGAAGFIGVNLCRFLLARGYVVRCLDKAPFDHADRMPIDVIQGDIRDSVAVGHAMRGVGAVLHAAAAPPSASSEEIFATNVAGTWTVVQTAIRHRVSRIVFLSSADVYGAQAHHLMHEYDPLHGVGPLAESKIEAEHLCVGARMSGSPISILRLSGVTGPGQGGELAKLFESATAGRGFVTVGPGSTPCQILDIEDLCEAIHLCLVMRPDLINDTFNLGARAFDSYRDTFQAVLDRAGRGKRIIALPRPLIRASLGLLEHLPLFSVCSWVRDMESQKSYVSVRHIDSRLGFQPRYSGTAALLRQYDRYARLQAPQPHPRKVLPASQSG